MNTGTLSFTGKKGGRTLDTKTLTIDSNTDVNDLLTFYQQALGIHTEVGVAISGRKEGLRMLSQSALRLYGRIAYHEFEGITETADESERIARELADKAVLILRNHGLLTVAATARGAYKLMLYLYDAARTQLMMEATGQPLVEISREVCERTAAQQAHADANRDLGDWPAALRRLDSIDPGYRS